MSRTNLAGSRAARCLGATDEFGVQASEMRVDAHDVNATIPRLLGTEHKKLTYLYKAGICG